MKEFLDGDRYYFAMNHTSEVLEHNGLRLEPFESKILKI